MLLISGGEDAQHAPAEHACLRDSLVDAGLTPDVCFVEDATHFDIVGRGTRTAVDWVTQGELGCPTGTAPGPDCE